MGVRDEVDDVLDVLALEAVHRRVFQGAERQAEADEVRLPHSHEACLERHPCINFLFYLNISIKLNNKKYKQNNEHVPGARGEGVGEGVGESVGERLGEPELRAIVVGGVDCAGRVGCWLAAACPR